MQMLKARSVFSLVVINKNFKRSVSINSSTVVENVKQTQNLRPWKEVPGPPSLPFVGAFFQFLPGGKLVGYQGIKLSERLYQLYGPIVKLKGSFGGLDSVLLFEPEAVEHVFRSEDKMPIRPGLQSVDYYRKRYNKTYDPELVTGLGTDQGEKWRDFRTKVNPIVMQPKTIKLYTDELEDVSSDMVARLRSVRDENNKIMSKLDIEMNLWALESVGLVALGTRLNCFDPNLPVDSPARKLIDNVHEFFDVAEKLDFVPSAWRLFSTPTFKKGMKIYEENERLTKYFIDLAIKKLKEAKKCSAETSNTEKSMLEKFLEIDLRVAYIMAADMLIAGVDTVSNTVIATMYLLAINPEKQNKLREEILAKRDRRPYLRACIKESMRMLPVGDINMRLSTKEYHLLGYKIPKGVLILPSHQYMCLMIEHFPKPDEFIPERWLCDKDDPLYYGNTHPFVMGPFSFGIRSCLGRRIAELELETGISKVIENFQIDWTSSEPLHIKPTILNYATEPFHFVFKDL